MTQPADLITLAPHLDAIMKHAATGAATLAALSTATLGEIPDQGVFNQWDLNLLASLGFVEPGYRGSARQAYGLTEAGRVYCRLKGYVFHE